MYTTKENSLQNGYSGGMCSVFHNTYLQKDILGKYCLTMIYIIQ